MRNSAWSEQGAGRSHCVPPPWTNLGLPRSTSAYPLPTSVYPSICRQRLVDIGLPLSTSVYVRWTAFAYLRLPSATSVGLPSARLARSVYLRLDQSTSAVVDQLVGVPSVYGVDRPLVYWGVERRMCLGIPGALCFERIDSKARGGAER
ncbi:hypothetical protein K438DRAFT_1785461 [Mycena galopus ATCC 62051]|nr:hypothetical protein K438DRAFT_1785461 [Mycena galopus ATCC 62051]